MTDKSIDHRPLDFNHQKKDEAVNAATTGHALRQAHGDPPDDAMPKDMALILRRLEDNQAS